MLLVAPISARKSALIRTRTAPAAASLPVKSGSNVLKAARPPPSRPCRWRPWGTPDRGTGAVRQLIALEDHHLFEERRHSGGGTEAADPAADHDRAPAEMLIRHDILPVDPCRGGSPCGSYNGISAVGKMLPA